MMAKRNPKPAMRAASRPAGKPPRKARVIGPAEQAVIARMYLQNYSNYEIGESLGVDEKTVRHHLEFNIRPVWIHSTRRVSEIELAKVDQIERIAWQAFEKSQNDETRETIKHELVEGDGKDGKKKADMKIVERALTTITTTGSTAWIQVIQWCIDFRSKILGHYAAHRVNINYGGEVRVAGKTRKDIDKELVQRIAFVVNNIEERKRLVESYGRSHN
jgi:ribosomal protein S7